MADDVVNQRIICEGGLNTNESDLILSEMLPGSASRLINFEVSTAGGYRRINGYQPLVVGNPQVGLNEAEGRVLGVIGFYNTKDRFFETFAARADIGRNTYSLYKHNPMTNAWDKVTLPAPRNMVGIEANVIRLRSETLNYGGGSHLVIVDGVNKILWYDGTDWKEIHQQSEQPEPPEEGELPDLPDPGGDQAIESPAVICVFKNHVFVAADDANGSIIAHSAPLQVDDWRVAQGAGQIFPGFDVVQIQAFRDELYVFGETQIKKIVVEGTTFVLKDVAHQIGCVARDSVLEVGGSLVFLSQDGIRPIAGTERINDIELSLLSREIQTEMDNLINLGDLQSLVGIPIRTKTQFRYFFGSGLIPAEEAEGIIGTIRMNARVQGDWEFGQLLGMRASSAWSGYRGTRELVLFGDYDGCVYQMEIGSTFNGNPIFSVYRTPYLDFGDTKIRKSFKTITSWIKSESVSEIFLGIEGDWSDQRLILPIAAPIDQEGTDSYYDHLTSKYDESTTLYSGSDKWNTETHIQGSFHSIRFSFVSYGDFLPFSIQSLVVELTPRGRQ